MCSMNLIKSLVNHSLYCEALTHSSTGKTKHNERLEFLGDAVLGLIISEHLYLHNSTFSEGQMSRQRAAVVREETLANVAKKLGIGIELRLGKGEEKTGGRQRTSLLANAMEALLGALYLSVGLDQTKEIIEQLFASAIDDVLKSQRLDDYKSEFQELMQSRGGSHQYLLAQEAGPDHDKTFWVDLVVDGEKISSGSGKTKKQAEQQAAKKALNNRLWP
ncbi:MAG: ribonuclease III [Firmicutes bacterium]|nr:ribonuclease III [Bacillota bacterium]